MARDPEKFGIVIGARASAGVAHPVIESRPLPTISAQVILANEGRGVSGGLQEAGQEGDRVVIQVGHQAFGA